MLVKRMPNVRTTALIVSLFAAGSWPVRAADEFTVKELPYAGGGIDLTVINNRGVALTGFTVKAVYHPGKGSTIATFIYDSLANGPSQPALKQGESYTWHMLGNPSHAQPPEYSVDAAIFADGLAIGDSTAIQSLWKRRQWAATGLQQVFQDLDSSVGDIENTDVAVSTLKRLESQRLPPGTPREERMGVSNAYGTVIAGLEALADRRAKGGNESAAAKVASLRKWAAERIAAIQSQVPPAQVAGLSPVRQ